MVKFLETSFTTKTLSEDNGTLVIEGFANRYANEFGEVLPDRDGDAILPSGYRLENFMKNPMILGYHDRGRPLGKALDVKIREDGLYIKAEIYKDLDPAIFLAVSKGVLSQFSVGFTTNKVKYNPDSDIFMFTDVELLEVSIVTIPANADSSFSLVKSACADGSCAFYSKDHKGDKTKEATPDVTPEGATVVPDVVPDVTPDVVPVGSNSPINLAVVISYLTENKFGREDFDNLLVASDKISGVMNSLITE